MGFTRLGGPWAGALDPGPSGDPVQTPTDLPPDRLRVRGESVEAGPAGWKEPGLGAADGQTNLQACRSPATEHFYP